MVTAYLSCSTNDHSSLPRRSPVPPLKRERPLQHFGARYYVSTIRTTKDFTNLIHVLFRRLWPSSISWCGLIFSYCLVQQIISCHLCSRSAFISSRRSPVPNLNRDPSNISVLVTTSLPYIPQIFYISYPRRVSPSVAIIHPSLGIYIVYP